MKDVDGFSNRNLTVSRRTISHMIEFRVIRLIFLQHVVNSCEQHPGNGDDRFLVAPPLFQCEVTAADFRELFGTNGVKCALNKQGLDIGPARLILVVFLFPALSLFCGVSPAQEQRCFEVGNTDISTPISEITPMAEKAWIPGAVATMLI